MLEKLGKDLSITLLTQALNGSEARHKVLADNIANANTPGYKRKDLPFQDLLRQAVSNPSANLQTTDSRHLPGRSIRQLGFSPMQSSDAVQSSIRVDGNNVDIEAEMAKLAENSLLYSALSDLLSRRISLLRSVINEGG